MLEGKAGVTDGNEVRRMKEVCQRPAGMGSAPHGSFVFPAPIELAARPPPRRRVATSMKGPFFRYLDRVDNRAIFFIIYNLKYD